MTQAEKRSAPLRNLCPVCAARRRHNCTVGPFFRLWPGAPLDRARAGRHHELRTPPRRAGHGRVGRAVASRRPRCVQQPRRRRSGRRPGGVLGHQRHRPRRAPGRRPHLRGWLLHTGRPQHRLRRGSRPVHRGVGAGIPQDQRHRPRGRARRRRRFLHRGRLHPGRHPLPSQRRPHRARRHGRDMGGDGLEPGDGQADPGNHSGPLGQHGLHRRRFRHRPGRRPGRRGGRQPLHR